ncbi:MAG TPA: bifunctional adenosylcobinamide kinase/adenosylcobinamide-phosphate guanylyltransferase [Ilumatobacteraceae bacterium]|nr:bifunctional adenosylcobinamide kinase/adenosylcobinamide-phosphate guanylyltransferase [Ilumatobacteraceae bacterium]
MGLTVLLGGARSGKSSLAVEIGMRHAGPVTYIATAPALDQDMADRIDRHIAERPPEWTTIEERTNLIGAMTAAGDSLAIIDCLTLWTSNVMWEGRGDAEIRELAVAAARHAAARAIPVVAVTNEVGLGVHPETDLGRRYRDVLGRVNQAWAAESTRTLFLVAGRALELHDPLHDAGKYLDT